MFLPKSARPYPTSNLTLLLAFSSCLLRKVNIPEPAKREVERKSPSSQSNRAACPGLHSLRGSGGPAGEDTPEAAPHRISVEGFGDPVNQLLVSIRDKQPHNGTDLIYKHKQGAAQS